MSAFLQGSLFSLAVVDLSFPCTSLKFWHNKSFVCAFVGSLALSNDPFSSLLPPGTVLGLLICLMKQYAGIPSSRSTTSRFLSVAFCGSLNIASAALWWFSRLRTILKMNSSSQDHLWARGPVAFFKLDIHCSAWCSVSMMTWEPFSYHLNIRTAQAKAIMSLCVMS